MYVCIHLCYTRLHWCIYSVYIEWERASCILVFEGLHPLFILSFFFIPFLFFYFSCFSKVISLLWGCQKDFPLFVCVCVCGGERNPVLQCNSMRGWRTCDLNNAAVSVSLQMVTHCPPCWPHSRRCQTIYFYCVSVFPFVYWPVSPLSLFPSNFSPFAYFFCSLFACNIKK